MQCSRTVIGWNVNRHLFLLLFSFSLASRRLIPPRCNIEMYCRCCLCGYLVWNVMCHIALGSSQTRRECFRNRLGAQFETIVHIPATFLLLAQTEMAAGIAQDDGKWSEQEVTRFAHLSNGQHNIRSMLTLIFRWFFLGSLLGYYFKHKTKRFVSLGLCFRGSSRWSECPPIQFERCSENSK